MPSIFISCRQSEITAGYASWPCERLAPRVCSYDAFVDIDSLELSVDFVAQRDRALLGADVGSIPIGPEWAHAVDDQRRVRLSEPLSRYPAEAQTLAKTGNLPSYCCTVAGPCR